MTTTVRRETSTPSRPQLWRVTDRAGFDALRHGQRVRRGPLSVTYAPLAPGAAAAPPRVAFAIGKGCGGAVERNRIRRRLRAALRTVQAEGGLPSGTYLLGGREELRSLPWPALVSAVAAAVADATGAGSPTRAVQP